jgi:hypothetical protein
VRRGSQVPGSPINRANPARPPGPTQGEQRTPQQPCPAHTHFMAAPRARGHYGYHLPSTRHRGGADRAAPGEVGVLRVTSAGCWVKQQNKGQVWRGHQRWPSPGPAAAASLQIPWRQIDPARAPRCASSCVPGCHALFAPQLAARSPAGYPTSPGATTQWQPTGRSASGGRRPRPTLVRGTAGRRPRWHGPAGLASPFLPSAPRVPSTGSPSLRTPAWRGIARALGAGWRGGRPRVTRGPRGRDHERRCAAGHLTPAGPPVALQPTSAHSCTG